MWRRHGTRPLRVARLWHGLVNLPTTVDHSPRFTRARVDATGSVRRLDARFVRRPGALLLALASALFAVIPVHTAAASPIDDKRAEADRLAQQIATNGDRIAALGEQFDGATLALHQA